MLGDITGARKERKLSHKDRETANQKEMRAASLFNWNVKLNRKETGGTYQCKNKMKGENKRDVRGMMGQ